MILRELKLKERKMDIELEKKLFKSYPKLFPKGRSVNPKESLICFGIECGDGWFDLINKLCHCIQKYLDDNDMVQVVVVQVKEKFGGLRFYAHNTDTLIDGMIWFVEHNSFTVCELCGEQGVLRDNHNWYRTLCEECYKKWKKK